MREDSVGTMRPRQCLRHNGECGSSSADGGFVACFLMNSSNDIVIDFGEKKLSELMQVHLCIVTL